MKILALGEFNVVRGSGWTTILSGLVSEWERRFYEVVILGFDYTGGEHPFKAAAIPTDPNMVMSQVQMIVRDFQPDVMVVAYDLSLHHGLRGLQQAGPPYIGVFVIESDPLIHPSEWTNTIDTMGAALCLSEFGTRLLEEKGIRARHLPPGLDPFWRPPTPDERGDARAHWNLGDKFVVFTNADCHERKNHPAHVAAIALAAGNEIEWPPLSGNTRKLQRPAEDVYWVLNTKKRAKAVSWSLYELTQRFGIERRSLILEHQPNEGLEPEQLRELYWAADAFMLLSKAEGFGLPILEAMACGVPVVGTATSGIAEQVGADRGILIPAEYVTIDPFHNQYRRAADPWFAAFELTRIEAGVETIIDAYRDNALAHAQAQTWKPAGDIFEEVLNELTQERSPAAAR